MRVVELHGVRPGEGPLVIRLLEALRIEGEVLDAAGDPVTSGTVWAEPLDGEPGARRQPGALDGKSNTFRIEGLAPGLYRLRMHANRAVPNGVVEQVVEAGSSGLVLRGR